MVDSTIENVFQLANCILKFLEMRDLIEMHKILQKGLFGQMVKKYTSEKTDTNLSGCKSCCGTDIIFYKERRKF